jgi:hypothetical protein
MLSLRKSRFLYLVTGKGNWGNPNQYIALFGDHPIPAVRYGFARRQRSMLSRRAASGICPVWRINMHCQGKQYDT